MKKESEDEKMKNPLRKRLFRELKCNWKKYAVLFLLLVVTIGFVSGMFVANDSMETAAFDAYEKYHIEDGHFTLKDQATQKLLEAFEEEKITVIPQFYKDFEEDCDCDGKKDAKVRVFTMRENVNRACLMYGEFPKAENEIAIDRMHADNNQIKVGDTICVGKYEMKVTGLVAFSDYSTLYEKNSDTMFDALTFNIAAVTKEGYEALRQKQVWQYAFEYEDQPADEEAQKEAAETLVKQLAVLSATGGMLDDEDAAKKLKDDVERWKDFLEEMQEKADDLQKRGDKLKEEGDALQAESDALAAEGEELKAKGNALKGEYSSLMAQIMTNLAGAGMMPGSDMATGGNGALPPEILAMLTPNQQSELQQLKSRQSELEEQGKELEKKGEDLKKRGDDLKERGDALQEEADALQARQDEIDDAADHLKELEPYEDHINELTDFVPEYANHAIHFAPEDMGSDKVMGEVLLILLVIVLAFIFAITASSTITSEASVIGTLRSSGYTRGELLKHYTTMPVCVTILAALVGNALGYTVFKNIVVAMYYNSYSLPTYVTLWNADAFIKTTLYPVLIMIAVNVWVVYRKLKLDPLKFLRHDLSRSKRKRAIKLPPFQFMHRFRLRILLQNAADYMVLFIGIAFVMILLSFSVGLPSTLKHYQDQVENYILTDYQYILKDMEDEDGNEITTKEATAEKYSIHTLETTEGVHVGEEVTVYGYVDNSRYFAIQEKVKDGEIYISKAYADKFRLETGQKLTLKESYGEATYTFTIVGIYDLPGSIAVFLPNDYFNEVFEKEKGSFTGYLAQNEITDIDEDMIVSVITIEDALKMAKQLDHSMGGYMDYFSVVCMLFAMLILYLLTKLIIEKNAISISMVKVLGYKNSEINSLYILLTSILVVIFAMLSVGLSAFVVQNMWKTIMYGLNGWFTFYIGSMDFVKMVAIVCIAYAVVALFDMRRIRRVPLTEALKNVE